MSAIQLTLIPHKTQAGLPYQHLHIQLTTANGIIRPSDLKEVKLPANIDYSQGIVIEGKAPIWLYGYLVHECHPAAWVGCYDTRLGAVVVATHTPDINVSQIFEITLPDAALQSPSQR
ncbi:MAG: CRISPR-associated ring nuclease Crn3/Csx3 [Jaaginema sp. PMC 1079.18]|nr:CRISPR-associated ring nuclease Crn3/Csx3 [Jaaginema sp. PMC 1080.18]MEC4853997.1 CRISPR-associated ring nuclease Crn3/Csx3 [Jaaginema sp. PMC 1079.18]MEC4868069.1 CRISPR-associated ring nuclease Crn3/Csx3 [Jaaginema sp. PMC 1078.18]